MPPTYSHRVCSECRMAIRRTVFVLTEFFFKDTVENIIIMSSDSNLSLTSALESGGLSK
jgi:hypothetical protein